jgi:cytochrome b561
MANSDYIFSLYAKMLHAGMAIFGIAAFLTGEIAEDGSDATGFYIHAYLGLSLTFFVTMRVMSGIAGSEKMRFSGWSPFSSRQWKLALQDVYSLIHLQIPERGMHEGLSGITQSFGLILFGWMGVTGTGLFLLIENEHKMLFEIIEELHEVGEALIPLYLALHVGSVLVHSLAGKPIWHRMWKLKTTGNSE